LKYFSQQPGYVFSGHSGNKTGKFNRKTWVNANQAAYFYLENFLAFTFAVIRQFLTLSVKRGDP